MKTISTQFKLKRKKMGLTQSKFADLLGIAQGYLSEIENGMKIPSNSLIILFVLLIGCTSTNKKMETHPTNNKNALEALDKFWDLLRPVRILTTGVNK